MMINRTQALVLGFLLLAWLSLVIILIAAPEVYDESLALIGGDARLVRIVFLGALSSFLIFLAAAVVRQWRWAFWLLLVALLAGVLRVPASILQLLGVVPTLAPKWYVLFQAVVGMVQAAIGLAMFHGYRRGGTWAPF